MAYVYQHIRLDTNEVFYIGVGGLLTFDNYKRANANTSKGLANRTSYWKHIVNKYGFISEIVLDNCTKNEAFQKEIELTTTFKYLEL